MALWSILRRLARRPAFRRLLAVRFLTQTADGTLQVGMASFILFSPQSQPNAAAIAAVLAITLLPFSLVGPFASILLDRWSRRQMGVVVDSVRALIALVVALLVFGGSRGAGTTGTLYVLLLVALSLNRFLLAGLTAALQHTVERDEYLDASAVMPMIGPMGLMLGGLLGGVIRLVGTRWMSTAQADGVIFCCAAALWVVGVFVVCGFGRQELGPVTGDDRAPGSTQEFRAGGVADVWNGLAAAVRHLGERRPAALGIAAIGVQRLAFGMLTVAVILMYRNHFHSVTQVNGALAGFGGWAGATGVGFVLSAVLVPPLIARMGLRATATLLLAASGVVQWWPGSVFRPWALMVSGLFLGWFAQSFKICVDTLVQAHVDEDMKGRVFVIQDGIFNGAIVVAALLAMALLPVTGVSRPVFWGMGATYVVLALVFWLVSGRIGRATFEEGTSRA